MTKWFVTIFTVHGEVFYFIVDSQADIDVWIERNLVDDDHTPLVVHEEIHRVISTPIKAGQPMPVPINGAPVCL